jgi:hypothetical protein
MNTTNIIISILFFYDLKMVLIIGVITEIKKCSLKMINLSFIGLFKYLKFSFFVHKDSYNI